MQPGLDADHSSPSDAMTKNEWSYTSISATSLHATDRYIYIFILLECVAVKFGFPPRRCRQ